MSSVLKQNSPTKTSPKSIVQPKSNPTSPKSNPTSPKHSFMATKKDFTPSPAKSTSPKYVKTVVSVTTMTTIDAALISTAGAQNLGGWVVEEYE